MIKNQLAAINYQQIYQKYKPVPGIFHPPEIIVAFVNIKQNLNCQKTKKEK